MCCASVLAQAAITITPANNIYVGATTYSGYGIYGAKEGELAQLLNGTYTGTVQWNGATLEQLKSAVLIKVGSSSNPNVLGNADLEALELLSGARFLDIDGSQLATGANIARIKAGSAIEAVTLPNQLTKEQVNAAGAALKACNSNFGSCMSLDAEMEEKEIYVYTDPCTSAEVEYTGTVSGSTGHLSSITRPLTEAGSSASFINTKFRDEVTPISVNEVQNGKVVPNPLKVELTENKHAAYSYNGTTYTPGGSNWWLDADGKVNSNHSGIAGLTEGMYLDDASTYSYTYVWRENWQDLTKTYDGQPEGNAVDGYYAMINNVYSESNGNVENGYQFTATATYNYTYTDPTDTDNPCSVKTASYTDGPHTTIDIPCNLDVVLTPKTVNVPVPGKNVAVAYVNTPGSLYQSVSLDVNDASTVEGLIISGNINNADIAVNSGAIDCDQGPSGDSDKFTSTGATAAFYVNNKSASIKSIDMSDAVLENYRHLRVMYYYGANLESVVFPKTLEKIPNYCCYSGGDNGCANLANIVFPTNATTLSIGDYAFPYTAINSLLLPSNVTRVGDHAFSNCRNLYDVEMESLRSDCLFGNNVFEACPKLQHVTLSEKVQNIGDYMFNQCGLLESIRIPSTCGTIGSYAFQYCYSIHQITIPEGVRLIKLNAFEGAGLTDIYLMATSIATLPMIYAMSPGGAGPSSFTHQRTTGNNTVPTAHRDDLPTADYDEVMTWYQEEQSGAQGLGTGNCLTALHYPESMKPFFEAIDVTEFYTAGELASIPMQTTQTGIKRYYTPDEYLAMANEQDKPTLEAIVNNSIMSGYQWNFPSGATHATEFGTDEEGNPIEYKYLPQSYAVDPKNDNSGTRRFGPDKDGNYYPNQTSYLLRMLAGATSTQAGGVGGEEVASAWGWRQFPLASSVESIGEIPYEKLYDDTWYTMCFPWKMEDNQLFSSFNQKCEIVEFKGAEMVKQSENSYSLVFHFDEVASTYYMDDEGVEYTRERDGDRVDGAGHNLYIYTPKNGGASISAPDPLPANPKDAAEEVKEQYGKYLTIKNIMVLPGHPYMIHPSIGANPGSPAKVYINGVKKVTVGGENDEFASYDELAASQCVDKVVAELTTPGEPGAEAWKTPDGSVGGSYTFIGNINDAVETDGVSDGGKKDMPLPCYFLGVKNGSYFPMYYRRTNGGQKKWSQYSAIIVPSEAAKKNIEAFMGSGSSAGAKEIVFGEWEIVDEDQMTTVIDNAVVEGKEKNEPAQIKHLNVVYNIKGQVIRNNSTSVEGLPKGLYIVNGKKYMVK